MPPPVTRVLVTGHAGKIGRVTTDVLEQAGLAVVGFDAADGDDVRDLAALERRAEACDAVVHLAAIPHDESGLPRDVIDVNVLGTFNVLAVAEAAPVRRVVAFSSIQASGVFGQRAPDYLPLDDDHPSSARTPYPVSKLAGEAMCRAFRVATGIPTVCLRPPVVLAPDDVDAWSRMLAEQDPPSWPDRAWCDVRDVARAVLSALTCPDPGPEPLLLSADDLAGDVPAVEVAAAGGVPWRGGEGFAPLVDASRARARLRWRPEHRWPRPDRGGATT